MVNRESIRRNKRILMTYNMERLKRLKRIRWTSRQLPEEVAKNLSPEEVDFFKGYDRCLSK